MTRDSKHQTAAVLSSMSFQIKHMPIKRSFDLIFSACVLAVLSPVFAVIAIAIRLSSKGPIIYGHERIGRGGRPFICYKFRTMHPDADARLQEILNSDKAMRTEWEQNYKLKKDPRITPVGAFLRRTSLDELPQFWNVLKGDLSVVGPRPVVHSEMLKFLGPKAPKILSIRPGLTGIWQVSGRNDTTYSTRLLLDEKYVDNHSFIMDLKLIAKTIPSMISSKGAY